MKKVSRYVLLVVALFPSLLTADTITVSGNNTAGQGQVGAKGVFTFSQNTLDVVLTNTVANPFDASQLLVSVSFVLTTGQDNGTLTSSTGKEVAVTSNAVGGYSVTGTASPTQWTLTQDFQSGFFLCKIAPGSDCSAQNAKETILGDPSSSNAYSNANGSIVDNSGHTPFLANSPEFVINIPGVTSNTHISSATFYFNTQASESLTGTPTTPTPEPGSMLLFGTGLSGLAVFLRKRGLQKQ